MVAVLLQNVALITPASKTLDPMLVNLPHVFSCPLCVKKILSDSVTVFIVVHEFTVICIRLKKKKKPGRCQEEIIQLSISACLVNRIVCLKSS